MSILFRLIAVCISLNINLNAFGQLPTGKPQQLIPFRVKDKWGLSDTTGRLIIKPVYDEALFLNKQGYIKVRKGKKWGILDQNGKKVTSIKYANVGGHGYPEYLTIYRKQNFNTGKTRKGIIDSTGKTLVRPRFIAAAFSHYSNKLIVIEFPSSDKKRYTSFMNEKGKFLFSRAFNDVIFFDDGYVHLRDPDTGLFGLMDPEGKLVADFEYAEIFDVQEGMVLVKEANDQIKGGYHFLDINTRKPSFDKKFYNVLTVTVASGGFTDGRAGVGNKQNKFGYIDRQGNLVIDYIYDEVTEFRNGMAIVKKGNKFGVIDLNGNEVVPFIYDDLKWETSASRRGALVEHPKPHHHSTAIIVGKINGEKHFGLVHKDFQTQIKYTYIEALQNYPTEPFKGFKFKEGKCTGVMDQKGKQILPPIYEGIGYISNDLFPVFQINKEPDRNGFTVWDRVTMAFVDSTGKFITPFNYSLDHIKFTGFQNNRALVRIRELSPYPLTYIDTSCKPITTISFQKARKFNNGFAIFENAKDGDTILKGFGAINREGEIITKRPYIAIKDFNEKGVTHVRTMEGEGVIDSTGREIIFSSNPVVFEGNNFLHNGYILLNKRETNKPMGYVSLKGKQFWQD